MICFEVSVNGRVVCTAGVDAARGDRPAGWSTLVCALGSFAERPGDAPLRLTLDVDGLADEVRMVWLERFDALAVGDTISVRILDSARADPPAASVPAPSAIARSPMRGG